MGVSTKKLILVPALVTLAVTLLRLLGELADWSATFFSREAGGAGAIVGIVWLVPVFGVYFALRLAKAGEGPATAGPAFGYAFLALALVPAAGLVTAQLGVSQQSLTAFGVLVVASLVGIPIALRGWPALGRVLLAYAFAARVPVVLVMLVAILGNWQTHYDVPPPGLPAMGPIAKWAVIGLLPQLTFWIWFTVTVGALFGAAAAAVAGRRHPGTAA